MSRTPPRPNRGNVAFLAASLVLATWLTLFFGGLFFEGPHTDPASWLALALVPSLVWMVILYLALDVLSEQPFSVSETGFVPTTVPSSRLLRGRVAIRFDEVELFQLASSENGLRAHVVLRDGNFLELGGRDGVEPADLRTFAGFYEAATGTRVRTFSYDESMEAIFPEIRAFDVQAPPRREVRLPIEMDAADFERRRHRAKRISWGLVLLALTLFVFLAVLILAGLLTRVSTVLPALVAGLSVAGLLSAGLGWGLLSALKSDARFVMDEAGIVPPHRPEKWVASGRIRASFDEVKECAILRWREVQTASILLEDGSILSLDTRGGVPPEAFDYLASRVPARIVDMEAARKAMDEPVGTKEGRSRSRHHVDIGTVFPFAAAAEIMGMILLLTAPRLLSQCRGQGIFFLALAIFFMSAGAALYLERRKTIEAWLAAVLVLLSVGFAALFLGC